MSDGMDPARSNGRDGGPGLADRVEQTGAAIAPFLRFFADSAYARRKDDPDIADFAFGNPHEMPLPPFVESLGRWLPPRNKDWFAYKLSEPPAQEAVAATLQARRGRPYASDDILMTNGAFAGIAVSLATLVNPGDEVIYISPPWFFYEAMIRQVGGVAVRVKIHPTTFDLDLNAIAAAITPRTRAILINSPHNPTGKIYPPETLRELAAILTAASARQGRPVYLLSDEAYHRIIFDGRAYPSPTDHYAHSLLIYTYGKTLLTPGQRIGYIALTPELPHKEAIRAALWNTQAVMGYAFPNALLQHALPELEGISIDIAHLQAKRDRMVAALGAMGYSLHTPEGTFYLVVRSPWADDEAFCELLGEHGILALPGAICELSGYFRLSLTANDGMIDRALPGFAAAYAAAVAQPDRATA